MTDFHWQVEGPYVTGGPDGSRTELSICDQGRTLMFFKREGHKQHIYKVRVLHIEFYYSYITVDITISLPTETIIRLDQSICTSIILIMQAKVMASPQYMYLR